MQTDWGGEYQKLNSFFTKVHSIHIALLLHCLLAYNRTSSTQQHKSKDGRHWERGSFLDRKGRHMWDGITTTETLICSDWETLVVPISQPGTPDPLLSRVWQLPFVPVGNTNRDKWCC